MAENVLEHLLQRVSSAPLFSAPFDYFHIEGIFPPSFYCEIQENLPEVSCFSQMGGYPERFYLDFETDLERLPFPHFLFWKRIYNYLCSPPFSCALFEKFQNQITRRYGDQFSNRKVGTNMALIRDQSDYSLGPHTDHPNKVITLLFYLPSNFHQKHLGTSLYVPKNRLFECAGHEHHPFKDFDRVFTVPFVPNSVFGFFRSNISFHGVEPIAKGEKERVSMSYTLWETI